MTADQCLSHIWLRDEYEYLGILQTLETSWMRRCLARRRWYRLFNAVRVFAKMRAPLTSIQDPSKPTTSCDLNQTNDEMEIPISRKHHPIPMKAYSTDSEEDAMLNGINNSSPYEPPDYESDLPPFVKDISTYYHNFEKLHLISNNGLAGTIFR